MVREHGPEHASQWAAITSIAGKFGCTPETLRNWVRQDERDRGQRGGLTTDERQRVKELVRIGLPGASEAKTRRSRQVLDH
jgi:transposase-like protein